MLRSKGCFGMIPLYDFNFMIKRGLGSHGMERRRVRSIDLVWLFMIIRFYGILYHMYETSRL